jgi:hypothetical protein
MADIVTHIGNPDPIILRDQAIAAALDGRKQATACPHPISAIEQFVDEEPGRERYARPTNLFQCGVCRELLYLVDPFGRPAAEG